MSIPKSTSARIAVLLGAGRFLDEVAGHAAEGGPRRSHVELARRTGADIYSYKTACTNYGRLFARLFARAPLWGSAVAMAARADRYGVIYATGEDMALRLLIVLKLLGRSARLVFILHNATPKKAKLFRLIGHRNISACVVLSSAQVNVLKGSRALPADKVRLVLEAVDTDFFDPALSRSERRLGLISCGAEGRDYPTLLSSLNGLTCRMAIYGHGYRADAVATGQSHGETVELAPRVSYEALRHAYAAARCAVVPLYPSAYASGLNGLLEPMAMGLPVVVTRTAGLQDYTEHQAELLVRPSDPVEMNERLRAILSSPSQAERLGQRNRDWVVANCSLDTFLHSIEHLLDSVEPSS